jgi:hypothetical protein
MLIAALAVSFILLFFFLYVWISELLFYRRKGWDFTIDNPNKFANSYKGDSDRDEDIDSNRERVFHALPFFIFVNILLVVGTCLAFFYPSLLSGVRLGG